VRRSGELGLPNYCSFIKALNVERISKLIIYEVGRIIIHSTRPTIMNTITSSPSKYKYDGNNSDRGKTRVKISFVSRGKQPLALVAVV